MYNLDANGDYPGTGTNGEVGWSLGSDPYSPGNASAGGVGQYEPEPSFQDSVQSTGYRTIPDISADADPSTGVPIYDPYDTGTTSPWSQWGGTSVASPLMAGMVAIADQGRVLNGGQTFSSDQILADLYSLYSSKPSDFHDIIHGYNGFYAGSGYDLVTGLGTPNGSQLVPDLASFGLSGQPTLTSIVVTPSIPYVYEDIPSSSPPRAPSRSGYTQNITSSVIWASATPSVATINTAGLATLPGRRDERDHGVARWRHEPRRHLDERAAGLARRLPTTPRSPCSLAFRSPSRAPTATVRHTNCPVRRSTGRRRSRRWRRSTPRDWPRRMPWARA